MKRLKDWWVNRNSDTLWHTAGWGRFEASIQVKDWALPFHFMVGRGAFVFMILNIQLHWWRGEMRYEKPEKPKDHPADPFCPPRVSITWEQMKSPH